MHVATICEARRHCGGCDEGVGARLGACMEVQQLEAVQHAGVCQLRHDAHDLRAPQPKLGQVACGPNHSTHTLCVPCKHVLP